MPSLEAQMRKVLLEMAVWLSHGTTANWAPTGAGGVPDSRPPTGEARPPQLYWAAKWDRAVSSEQKEAVIEGARAELEGWRVRPIAKLAGESSTSEDSRIVLEGRGWSIAEVAQHFRCTPTRVRRVRLAAGCTAEKGEATSVSLELVDEEQRARELAERGLSERQIAMFLNRPKTTARRVLGRAA